MEISSFVSSRNSKLKAVEFSALPFRPERLYWISNLQIGEIRGRHAHKELQQAFFLVNGVIEIRVHDGHEWQIHTLDERNDYFFLDSGRWREYQAVLAGSRIAVLASAPYREEDYIHDWNVFLDWSKGTKR